MRSFLLRSLPLFNAGLAACALVIDIAEGDLTSTAWAGGDLFVWGAVWLIVNRREIAR